MFVIFWRTGNTKIEKLLVLGNKENVVVTREDGPPEKSSFYLLGVHVRFEEMTLIVTKCGNKSLGLRLY